MLSMYRTVVLYITNFYDEHLVKTVEIKSNLDANILYDHLGKRMLTVFFNLLRTLISGFECYLQKESNLSARNTMVFPSPHVDYYRKQKYILIFL